MRTPLIAGNWKMYKTPEEGVDLVRGLIEQTKDVKDVEILVCPPFPCLAAVGEALSGSSIRLGAQNLYPKAEGAYTGEVSAGMLKALGCSYVILGHSERRMYFFETDEFIREKTEAALDAGLIPIICVGESLEEREQGRTFDRVGYQMDRAVQGMSPDRAKKIVIAYEPVWAIGTGKTATDEQAQEVHAFIREKLSVHHGKEVAEAIRILYGGSVKPANAAGLMSRPDIDGGLVGGASLKADSFAGIANYK